MSSSYENEEEEEILIDDNSPVDDESDQNGEEEEKETQIPDLENFVETAARFLPSFIYQMKGLNTFLITVPSFVLPLSLRKANFDQVNNIVTVTITLKSCEKPFNTQPLSVSYDSDGNKNFLGKPLVQNRVNQFFQPNYQPTGRFLRSKQFLLNNKDSSIKPKQELIESLLSMGFSERIAKSALIQYNNDLESATNAIISGSVYQSVASDVSYEESPIFYLTLEIVDGFLDLVDHCCICGKPLEVSGIKPVVCDNKLCYFSFVDIGVGSNLVQEIRRDPIAADLVISLASVAAGTQFLSPRPQASDQMLNEFFQRLPSTHQMASLHDDHRLFDLIGKDFYDILRFIMLANRSHLITLNGKYRLPEAPFADYQFLITSAPPERESALKKLIKKHGQIWLWHGSPGDRWYSIFHNGLKDYGSTAWQTNDGHWEGILGVYESDEFAYSYGYSQRGAMVNKYMNSSLTSNFHIVALVENAKMPNLKWVMNNEYAQRNENALIPRVIMLVKCFQSGSYFCPGSVYGSYRWNTVENPPKHVPTLEEIIDAPLINEPEPEPKPKPEKPKKKKGFFKKH